MAGAPTRPMLVQVRDAPDAGDEPRVGLLLPPKAGSASTKPVLQVYESVAAALRAKRQLEMEVTDARP